MKKIISVIMLLGVLMMLFGCTGEMSGMPKYESKECHYSEGFQDYTDYCKYFYNKETIKKFETHAKFKKVSDSNIDDIKSFFEDYTQWVKMTDYYDKYDFDYSTQIKKGDYFYINEKSEYEKYDDYDVYYVDMTKQILYFIHTNI